MRLSFSQVRLANDRTVPGASRDYSVDHYGSGGHYQVHGEPAGNIVERPWGERSFYVVDPWGNNMCFCQDGTLYT